LKKRILFSILLLALVNLANAFKVSPVKLELSIPRGQTREVILTLNGTNGAGVEYLSIYPTDLTISKTGVNTFQRIEKLEFSAVPWIKFSEANFSLSETQKKELKFKISVPLDANPGEYYSIIMIEPEKDTRVRAKDRPLAMDYKVRIGVVLLLDVPGRIYGKTGKALSTEMIPITAELIKQIKAETLSGKYDSKHSLFYTLPDFEKMANKTLILGSFQNFGNTHLDVSGSAIIRSKDGRTSFGQTKLIAMGGGKEQVFTFPGDERYFIGVWEKHLPKGEYRCDAIYDYGDKTKKAMSSSNFSIIRETNPDESKAQFLIVDKNIDLQVPVGALRTIVAKISNSDYRVINVSFISDSWIQIEPQSFALEPGQTKNIKLTISNDGKSKKEATIVAKPDRGRPSEIKLSLTEKAKVPEKLKKGAVDENYL
jgi:hypothetical protein